MFLGSWYMRMDPSLVLLLVVGQKNIPSLANL